MFVNIFPINGQFTVCAITKDGTMDPHYCAIPDLAKGQASYIADRINEAYRRGQSDNQKELRKALGL